MPKELVLAYLSNKDEEIVVQNTSIFRENREFIFTRVPSCITMELRSDVKINNNIVDAIVVYPSSIQAIIINEVVDELERKSFVSVNDRLGLMSGVPILSTVHQTEFMAILLRKIHEYHDKLNKADIEEIMKLVEKIKFMG